ncbi:DUF2188 domain-containing protein [Saccharicrinis sp. FJH62]|uniref:DUF2188 domain-containing protein n=1 Tax=Saccharicrinis sp. FJH62 TaxID=3344657 RepID=UPI0035D3FF4D
MTKKASKSNLTEKFSKAASSNSGRVHVVPSKSGWSVKKEGAKRSTAVRATREDAIKAAKDVKSADRIIVHKKDGTIQRNTKKR